MFPTWWRKVRDAGRLSSAQEHVCHCWADLCWRRGRRSPGRLHGCWVSPGRPWPRCRGTLWCWSEAPSCHLHLWGKCDVFGIQLWIICWMLWIMSFVTKQDLQWFVLARQVHYSNWDWARPVRCIVNLKIRNNEQCQIFTLLCILNRPNRGGKCVLVLLITQSLSNGGSVWCVPNS